VQFLDVVFSKKKLLMIFESITLAELAFAARGPIS